MFSRCQTDSSIRALRIHQPVIPGVALSVERESFHTELPDQYGRLASLIDLSVFQSGKLLPFYSTTDFRPVWAYLRTPPLLFRRPPPQWNYPASRLFNILMRKKGKREWYSNVKHAFPPILYTFLFFPLETYNYSRQMVSQFTPNSKPCVKIPLHTAPLPQTS